MELNELKQEPSSDTQNESIVIDTLVDILRDELNTLSISCTSSANSVSSECQKKFLLHLINAKNKTDLLNMNKDLEQKLSETNEMYQNAIQKSSIKLSKVFVSIIDKAEKCAENLRHLKENYANQTRTEAIKEEIEEEKEEKKEEIVEEDEIVEIKQDVNHHASSNNAFCLIKKKYNLIWRTKNVMSEKMNPKVSRRYQIARKSSINASNDTKTATLLGKSCSDENSESINSIDSTFSPHCYLCYMCDKEFDSQRSLSQHMRVHSDVKRKRCDICDAEFIRLSTYKAHLLTHTDARPYKCEQCGKGFLKKPSLKYHLKKHAGIKPHRCHYCHKGFIQLNSLKTHLTIHTDNKPFKCEMCDKKFSQRQNLINHYKLHDNLKPFDCHECKKKFVQKSSLLQHVAKHHSESYVFE